MQPSYPEVIAGPPGPSVIRQPGLLALPAGMERYQAAGAGAVFIGVEAGDAVTIRNVEGGQACELIASDASGKTDAGILGVKANSNAAGLKALLLETDPSLNAFRTGLERRAIDLAEPQAVRIFGATTAAGVEETFTVSRDGSLIVAAPGGPMPVDGHDTATPLLVMVQRARIRTTGKSNLPDPLADPVLDLRVKSATAQAYFVKAGDFIQIIDVDGRQCTDFQCFSARKLDQGKDHALDATTTRTLTGSSYPMPGLHSKYYRPGFGAAGRDGAGYVRPSRCLRARLQRRNTTTTSAIPGMSTALKISTARSPTRGSRPKRLDGDQFLLQYRDRRA